MTLAPVRADLDGRVEIAVAADGTYPTLHSSGALAARATIDGVWLVGASAHPIGGDRLAVAMDVGAEAFLSVHSASATLARGSDPPRPSRMDITATVGPGGTLHWAPAPGIAANGSRHAADAVVGLHPTAAGSAWIASKVGSILDGHGVRPAPAGAGPAPIICDHT